MTAFFENTEKKALLQTVAESWIGTPFFMNGAFKSAGVSCQMLPVEIFKECGATITFQPLKGTGGIGDGAKQKKMSDFIAQTGQFTKVEGGMDALEAGDLLTFKVENGEYHMGLFLAKEGMVFLHSIPHYGVSKSNLYDPTYSERFLTAWRLNA